MFKRIGNSCVLEFLFWSVWNFFWVVLQFYLKFKISLFFHGLVIWFVLIKKEMCTLRKFHQVNENIWHTLFIIIKHLVSINCSVYSIYSFVSNFPLLCCGCLSYYYFFEIVSITVDGFSWNKNTLFKLNNYIQGRIYRNDFLYV